MFLITVGFDIETCERAIPVAIATEINQDWLSSGRAGEGWGELQAVCYCTWHHGDGGA